MRASLLSLCLLAGCATPPIPPPAPEHAALARTSWDGRLSLRIESNKPQAWSANFELTGQPEQGKLALTSPFGTRLLEANWSAQSAILVLPEGQRSYPDMAALTQSTLGAPLPVSALFDWLEGRPMPNIPSVLTPEGFEQSGWRIDTHAKAQGRLTVQRQTPEPPMTLRVVLSEP